MKRKWIIAAIVLLGLGALAGGALMLGPRLLQTQIESQLVEKLEARGIEATWGAFEPQAGGTFRLTDLRVRAPRHGVQFDSDQVDVSMSLDAIWSGEVSLTEVRVAPTTVQIDVAALLDRDDTDEAPTPTASSGGESRTDQILRDILENPPVVALSDTTILVVRGEEELMRVSSDLVSVKKNWGDFVIAFDGTVEFLAAQIPAVARGVIPWKVHGKLVPARGEFEYEVTSPEDGAPLVRVDVPEVFGLEVGRVWGAGTVAKRTGALNIDAVDVVLGPGEIAALHVKVPSVELSMQENGRPRIALREPSVYAAPKRRAVIVSALRQLLGRDEASSEGDADATTTRASDGAFARFGRLAARTDVELERLAVGLHMEDDAGELHTLTLLQRLDTHIANGLIRTTGTTAGGTIFAEAEVLPGQSWPHYMIARVEDVKLEQIPGLSRERTALPSRGTSGRVGGVVNMNLALTMPSQGMDGPLGQDAGIGEFSIDLRNGHFDLTGLAEEPIDNINARSQFTFTFEPQLALITLVEGDATYGPLHFTLDGRVEDFPLDTQVVFNWEMAEVECQALITAIPKALLGPYAKVELEGTIQPSGWLRWPLYRPLGMRSTFEGYADVCETVALKAARSAWPEIEVAATAPSGPHKSVTTIPPNRAADRHDDVWWLNRPFKKRVTEGLSDLETVEVWVGPGTAEYVPLEQLPSYVYGVMYLSEQIDFYVDGPLSESLIKKALRLNLDKGRFVYGGSTVTQQLVKNLFLTRDKTFARKFQEAMISWRIDDVISKDRVLELYLNCIEFGPDIYGIGPAARYYFNKDARNLSIAESVFLAMLKPSPWYGASLKQRGRTPSGVYWTERIIQLVDRLVEHKFITRAQAEAGKPYTLEWTQGVYKDRNATIPLLDW